MFQHSWRRLSAVLVVVFLFATAAAAQSLDQLDTALRRVPADAAFFSTMLRNKEQIDLALQSKAWQKLWNMPIVQMGWGQFQAELKKNRDLQAFLGDKDNQELLALAGDGVSHEVFLCGGEGWSDFINFFQEIYGTMYWNSKLKSTPLGAGNDPRAQFQAMLEEIVRQQDRIKIPDIIIGFKLSDAKRADNQLARLESLVAPLVEGNENLKGRLKSEKINGGRFLVLRLDGSMIPWDEFPRQLFEDQKEQIDTLIAKLKSTTLTISLGVQNGYLMLALGSGTKHLVDFGGSGPRLHSVAEFKPLAKFADRKLVDIQYVSKKLMTTVNPNVDMKELVGQLKNGLSEAPLSDEQKTRLIKDAEEFAGEWKLEQLAGAQMSFHFLTSRGMEGYSYNYGKQVDVESSKALTLLDHIGGNPVFAAVGRSKVDGKSYAFFSKWVKVIWGHIDEFTQSQLDEDAKEKYELVTGIALPALKRIDAITSQGLIPALADGQSGFVIDAKWKSKQWLTHLPPTPRDMPMLELAIVLGVSDDAKLASAMSNYRKVINDLIATIGKIEGFEAVTLARIPPPETAESDEGTLYYYPLPGLLRLDERVAPTAGLSKKVAALTLSHEHAQRLLKTTKPMLDSTPLAKLDRPLAGASVFNFPELVQAVTPWVNFAADTIIADTMGRGGQEVPAEQREFVMSQVRTVLEVLQSFGGGSSATYLENGALVTHSETVVRDLK